MFILNNLKVSISMHNKKWTRKGWWIEVNSRSFKSCRSNKPSFSKCKCLKSHRSCTSLVSRISFIMVIHVMQPMLVGFSSLYQFSSLILYILNKFIIFTNSLLLLLSLPKNCLIDNCRWLLQSKHHIANSILSQQFFGSNTYILI